MIKNIILFFTLLFVFSGYSYGNKFDNNLLETDFKFNEKTPKSVSFDELHQGCSKIDCIESIDKPKFVTVDKSKYLQEDSIVLLVDYNGIKKVYPRNLMQIHEIVNDTFGDKPLAVTYCPLCGSAVGLVPIIDNERVEFGVSGVLHNSDLVLYDRKTRSLWGQITGRAIVGEKTGTQLTRVNVSISKWSFVKEKFKSSLILEPNSSDDEYNKFHYLKYAESDKTMFPVSIEDARLNRKKLVYGIEYNNKSIAYEENYLLNNTPVIESFAGITLKITKEKDGTVTAINKMTGEQIFIVKNYWFAWYSFYPQTLLRL